MGHHLDRLLAPTSIALVGASPTPDTPGSDMVRELRSARYPGDVFPVNPKYDTIEGFACAPSMAELPVVPDMAVLGVGNARLEEQVGLAIELGVGGLVIPGSVVLADDSDRDSLRRRVAQLARDAGMPIVGGNCMGFYNVERSVRAFPFNLDEDLAPGGVTWIAQSGSVLTALLWNDRKLAFNLAISPGSELVTTTDEYMDYALDLDSTRVIALFLETVRRPAAFIAALEKAAARNVPVVALKVGRTAESAKLAISHSGAIAGDDAVYQAVFERHGVLTVRTLDELAATALLMSSPRRPSRGGLATIHDSGGERELLIDLAADVGVRFAAIDAATTAVLASNLDLGLEPINPLDAWGTGNDYETIYGNCWQALLDDDDTAIGAFVIDWTSGFYLHESFARICLAVHARTEKPVVMLTNHVGTDSQDLARRMTALGVPVLDGTVSGLVAIRNALAYRDFQARRPLESATPVSAGVTQRWRTRLQTGNGLDEAEALELLGDYRIPVVIHRTATDLDSALIAAADIGYPVVVKTATAGIHHKSDVGGVVLGVADSAQLTSVYADISRRLGPNVLIAAMTRPDVELALGMLNDAQFGPLLLIASGGLFIEVLKDRMLTLVPADTATAIDALGRLAIAPVLRGTRGRPAADVVAIAAAVVGLSTLAADVGDLIAELDINPLAITSSGCVALDALIIPKATVVAEPHRGAHP